MSLAPFQMAPLTDKHVRTAFRSGEEALDRYIKTQAGQDVKRGYASVIVAVNPGDDVVQGYYTLSASSVELAALPDKLKKRLPRYGQVPAILLGRLAVNDASQGKGLGGRLLADALKRSCRLLGDVGWVVFIVKAKHPAAAEFYKHFGFETFPCESLMLYIDKKAALLSVGDDSEK